jgi:hypothetical protein
MHTELRKPMPVSKYEKQLKDVVVILAVEQTIECGYCTLQERKLCSTNTEEERRERRVTYLQKILKVMGGESSHCRGIRRELPNCPSAKGGNLPKPFNYWLIRTYTT